MIGANSVRKEGRAKVLGRAIYTDDKFMPGALHGVTVRSSVPRGILREIVFGEGIAWDEFTIVTAADIPGINRVASVVDDQPFLVGLGEEIRAAAWMGPLSLTGAPLDLASHSTRR